MVQNGCHDIWVGSELGLLKGVDVQSGNATNYGDLKSLDKAQGITVIDSTKSTDNCQILLGLKDGSMKVFDLNSSQFSSSLLSCGTTPVCGIVSLNDGSTLTCTEDGLLKLWKDNDCQREKKIGSHIQTLVASSSLDMVASGGKENDLKIWKVEDMDKSVFVAKNVRNDFLNLRVPVWISAIQFFNGSTNEVVVGTGNHTVRVYDVRVKRRPVLDFEYHEHPITALSLTRDNKTVVVGNSASYMAELDLKMAGKIVGGFKGNTGSIRDIHCHPTQPYVISCGLDRFLKIYDLSSRRIEKKIYLKSNLNCILMTDKELLLAEKQDSRKREFEDDQDDRTADDDDDDDDDNKDSIWENMQVIKEKKKKKNEHVDN